jgi:hypothetical protein
MTGSSGHPGAMRLLPFAAAVQVDDTSVSKPTRVVRSSCTGPGQFTKASGRKRRVMACVSGLYLRRAHLLAWQPNRAGQAPPEAADWGSKPAGCQDLVTVTSIGPACGPSVGAGSAHSSK